MKKRTLFGIGIALLALLIAVPAAFSRGPRGGGPDGERGARIIEKLGLNEQQVAQLTELRDDHREEMQSLREQIRTKVEAIKQLWLAPNPDRAKITAAAREIGALEAQMAEERIDFMFAARSFLTPEQFKKFVEMKGHRGFGRGMHGPGFGHGGRGMGPRDGKGPGAGPRDGTGRGFGPRDGTGPGCQGDCPFADDE